MSYTLNTTVEDYENGMHCHDAELKAEEDGYVVLATFDQDEPAGRALYEKTMIYGDEGRYLSDIVADTDD